MKNTEQNKKRLFCMLNCWRVYADKLHFSVWIGLKDLCITAAFNLSECFYNSFGFFTLFYRFICICLYTVLILAKLIKLDLLINLIQSSIVNCECSSIRYLSMVNIDDSSTPKLPKFPLGLKWKIKFFKVVAPQPSFSSFFVRFND